MKRNFFILLMLGASLVACSKQYYPQMYEKAGEDSSENVIISEAETTTKNDKIVESSDKYTTEDGAQVVYAYHVVVGSFSSRTNASNLSIELNKSGVKATVAVNQNGLYRVFYYSTDNEPDVRAVLAKARKKYPDAWMLKLVAR